MWRRVRGVFSSLVTFIAMMTLSCSVSTRTSAWTETVEQTFDVTVYISDSFSPQEHENIIKGVGMWKRSLGDRLTWRAIVIPETMYVSDVNRVSRGKRMMNVVFKRASSNDKFVVEWDAENKRTLLGMCTGDPDDETMFLFLVESRLVNDDMETFVAAHEFGHALGVEHVDDESSLMSDGYNANVKCMTEHDAEALCDARGCVNMWPERTCVNQPFVEVFPAPVDDK